MCRRDLTSWTVEATAVVYRDDTASCSLCSRPSTEARPFETEVYAYVHDVVMLAGTTTVSPFTKHLLWSLTMIVTLTANELAELDRQNPATRSRGGFQGLMVGLQLRVDRATGRLLLTERDLERIGRYAFDYHRGGWQGRLQRIFQRELGPLLGRQQAAA